MNSFDFSILAWLMIVSSGLMAGIYFTFSNVVMRSLATLTGSDGAIAMNAINRIIVKTAFMPLFFGSTLLSILLVGLGVWSWATPGSMLLTASGAIYFVGMFVVTAFGNVPLNNKLDRAESKSNELPTMWAHYLTHWTRLNTIRAISCTLAMTLAMAVL